MREGKCIDLDMNIFIVEDDIAIFDSLKERLGQWSFQVSGPTDFHEVMGTFMQEKPRDHGHLLPAYDGAAKFVRYQNRFQIGIITARDDERGQ